MNVKKEILIEMIKTEKNMAELYRLFAGYFEKDRRFWSAIKSEEDQHASLLESAVLLLALDMLPDIALIDKLKGLNEMNRSIVRVTEAYGNNMPPKEEAYNFAIQMEKSLGEKFFQELLKMKLAPGVVAAWQQLADESIAHSERIAALLSPKKQG
jgi:hypothetical protein